MEKKNRISRRKTGIDPEGISKRSMQGLPV